MAFRSHSRGRVAANEVAKTLNIGEHLGGATQEPAANLFHWYDADQIDGDFQAMGIGQLALRTGTEVFPNQ